jgi:hypothetical protein
MSKPVISITSRELESLDHVQKGNNSGHRTRNSRWSSEGSHPIQEGKEIETEHRLSLWIPIKVGRCSPLCYTKLPSPLEDLVKREGYRTKSLDLCLESQREFD